MNNYKNLNTGEVISESCYNKLSYGLRRNFVITSSAPTHYITEDKTDDDGNFLTNMIVGAAVADMLFDSPSFDNGPSIDSTPDVEFGGGDFGGAGAGSDW